MREPHSRSWARESVLLRKARKAARKDPTLAGAMSDPETIRAADGVIATMRERNVIPTALNVFRHLDDQGFPEERALILAAIVEQRVAKATRAR